MSAHTYRCFGGSIVAGGSFSVTCGGPHALIDDLGPFEVQKRQGFSDNFSVHENRVKYGKIAVKCENEAVLRFVLAL